MPEEAAAPQFVRYVSCVKGRLVSRWDAPSACFGARVSTFPEREAGAESIVWDEDCVIPLTAQFCARFDRELRNAVRNGDLRERKAEDHAAWLKLEETRENERFAKAEAAAKEATEPTVEAPAQGAPTEPTTPPGEAEATPKAGRKKQQ
jgi:hypothetical protein